MNVQTKNTFENKCLQNWTVSDAVEFLTQYELKMYKETFIENRIDGEVI